MPGRTSRPAVTWDPQLIQENSNCYWEWDGLNALIDGDGSISYEALFRTVAFLVDEFRCKVSEQLLGANISISPKHPLGIPIAVAIPEGPLLLLAILMVHALNVPFSLGRTFSAYAVLIPLEPTEGKERLQHMIEDARPVMILTLSEQDGIKLNDIVESIPTAESSISFQGLFQSSTTAIVDFSVSIRHALERAKIPPAAPLNLDSFPQSTSLQEIIIHICDKLKGNHQSPLDTRVSSKRRRISHFCFTSGTTGRPKGCVSSIDSLQHYLAQKNEIHEIDSNSKVLLASALSFDPCLSDILATFQANATLVLAPRKSLLSILPNILEQSHVSHILCTPTLWGLVHSSGARPMDFPSLKKIALGGEPIPAAIRSTWSRPNEEAQQCGLYATYGVTEACVYQTMGEILQKAHAGGDNGVSGQDVGVAFPGLAIRICMEEDQASLVETKPGGTGEVVLGGSQLDEVSSYLNRSDWRAKFIETKRDDSSEGSICYYYRTGDRGFINAATGRLHILGRIQGEEGMLKINGVRIEIGEIEAALVDQITSDTPTSLVTNCMMRATRLEGGSTELHAFLCLTPACRQELGINDTNNDGIWITHGPLLTLLRHRCQARVKVGCIPSAFVVIPAIPMSPTGKRDRKGLPKLQDCLTLSNVVEGGDNLPLRAYGSSGAFVAEQIVDCLNLQPYQQKLLTTSISFAMLGGDSLAATRVMRALYAHHHKVQNNRFLGGQYADLGKDFDAVNLLRSKNLGEFVDRMDAIQLCDEEPAQKKRNTEESEAASTTATPIKPPTQEETSMSELYEALMQAATSGLSLIAMALLEVGADPNHGAHGGRLGKTSGRMDRKAIFRSNPLHLACLKGDDLLVSKLLERKAKFNSPDASGLYPLHLAATGLDGTETSPEEDTRRLKCVKLLLEAGAPLTMKDGNKQSVLHAASRAGHCQIIEYILDLWMQRQEQESGNREIYPFHFYNWQDRWHRTPVHWAVLNGRVQALQILLEGGCYADPPQPKANKGSSAATESPLQICHRVHGDGSEQGRVIQQLLESFAAQQSLSSSTSGKK